ncbi:HD-GYP domain-containing protein [Desulfomonile tiedjei]|uniref:HD-GYP domain-containing protein n=1 Tax=Desulfomonile tiedjei TaxID=2358 RepID=UPI0012FBEB5D|nr:HD domain-containing phosphohydrolase [Desulfomonile tiedjei]
MKDNCTGFHMARTGLLSALLAEKLGLKPDVVHQIYLAAPMHDIGKIAIPDSILLKPGPLTPDEFEIMKSHTIIGARIFQSFNDKTLRVAHSIALCHHEKWDGTGYPAGLKGYDIPIAGRIVALADACDAMCSLRPYREPLPLQTACESIEEGRGSHFDPSIVDTFFEYLPLVREIQQRIS